MGAEGHMRAHSNEMPYRCALCGRAFARASDRARHERMVCKERAG